MSVLCNNHIIKELPLKKAQHPQMKIARLMLTVTVTVTFHIRCAIHLQDVRFDTFNYDSVK